MDRLNWYFKQKVSQAELDLAFDQAEAADFALLVDQGVSGVMLGAVVTEDSPPSLSLRVSGPAIAYDKLGQRLELSAQQIVNLGFDSIGSSTQVDVPGQSRILSLFLVFTRNEFDPRTDGDGATVYFRRDESFQLRVVMSEVAASPTAPPLLSDGLLLADITRAFGQATITNANISTTRRQDAWVLSGTPKSIRRGRQKDVFEDLLLFHNYHAQGLDDRHTAVDVDYAGGGNWANGDTNPPATVGTQLTKMLADLSGPLGASRVGIAAPGPAWADGTQDTETNVGARLSAIVNDLAVTTTGSSGAGKVGCAVGPSWADGTTTQAASVRAQLHGVISLLGASTGAAKVGAAVAPIWADGNGVAAGTVEGALAEIVSDLAGSTGADKIGTLIGTTWADGSSIGAMTAGGAIAEILADLAGSPGAARVGASGTVGSPNSLSSGTVRSQLDQLLAFVNAASGGAAASWTRDSGTATVRLTTVTDVVGIGTATVQAGHKAHIAGDLFQQGNLRFGQESARQIEILQTVSGAGRQLTVRAGNGSAAFAGGALLLEGGTYGTNVSFGAKLTLNGGPVFDAGGSAVLRGGLAGPGNSGNAGTGGSVQIIGENGNTATGGIGGTGGNADLIAGASGSGSLGSIAGIPGSATVRGGAAGNSPSNAGAIGGSALVEGGAGGASGTNGVNGGAGGPATLRGGIGGLSQPGGGTGGIGGTATVSGGDGYDILLPGPGGPCIITGGKGGNGVISGAGGAIGGTLTAMGGTGGIASSGSFNGNGGTATFGGGSGGSAGPNNHAGNGGAATFKGGDGGVPTVSGLAAGAGAAATFRGGDAGTSGSAAAGGSATLRGGNASGTIGNADGGNVSMDGGVPFGTGTPGAVNIGRIIASATNIGRTGIATVIYGNVTFPDTEVGGVDETAVTTVKTSNYVAAINETVRCDPSAAGFFVTLPTAVGNGGRKVEVKNVTNSANSITVQTTSSQFIDGAFTDFISEARGSRTYRSDGVAWMIV